MKLRKIISAVCALAMTVSMVTVVNAASLGGNVKVSATFAGYEIDAEYDNQIVAKIDFELDASAAEALSVYAESGKGSSKVKTGNGVTTAGISWEYDSDFEYWDDTVSETVFTLNGNGNAVSFGPKTAPAEYLTDSVVKFSVRYAVYDNDTKGYVTITGASLDGKNTTDGGVVWAYHTNKSNIDVISCSIPSYNEWSTPVSDDKYEEITSNQTVSSTNATEGKYASTDGTMKTLKHVANVLKDADATKRIRIIKTLNGVSETMETQRSISDVLGGVAVADSKVSAKVAIGVLTADADAVFSFELID